MNTTPQPASAKPEPYPYTEFWKARDWLTYIHAYAIHQRLNPFALLLTVLARISACIPPNVTALAMEGALPMTLNLNVVLIGRPSGMKSSTINHAAQLVPIPDGNAMRTLKPRTGEGIISSFAHREERKDADGKRMKGEYETVVDTPQRFIELPEITAFTSAVNKQDSTVLETVLNAYSNEEIGGATRGVQSNIVLPPYSYRLSAVLGAQPTETGVIYDRSGTGLAARLLYTTSHSDAPDKRPPAPHGPFPLDLSTLPTAPTPPATAQFIDNKSEPADWHGITVRMPQQIGEYADRLQTLSARGQVGDMEGHALEPLVRMAAIFALVDARTVATMEDCRLAQTLCEHSNHARDTGLANLTRERRRKKAQRLADNLASGDQAHELYQLEQVKTVADRIEHYIGGHDQNHEGIPRRTLQQSVRYKNVEMFNQALNMLMETGRVEVVGTNSYALPPRLTRLTV